MPKLGADLADDQAFRVRCEQEPDDAQPRFGPERGEHVGVAGGFLGVVFAHGFLFYISMNAEIWNVKPWQSGRRRS